MLHQRNGEFAEPCLTRNHCHQKGGDTDALKSREGGNGFNIHRVKLKMANTLSVMTNVLRNVVSKQRIRYREKGFNLDLAYICDNIIAMGYPADFVESLYRNRLEDVYKFLEENHQDHYKIYNLCSERNYDINRFHGRVAVYAFEDHNPPTIELIQRFCDDVDTWLKADNLNVAAVHCKAGKGRTGTMICCYLLYSGQQTTAEDALAHYDEKRTKDRKGVTIPSQRRYVQYFAKLIRSNLTYERRTLQFCEIRFSEANMLHSQSTVNCSISSLEKTERGVELKPIKTFPIDFRKGFTVDLKNLLLSVTGDVKVELTHKTLKKKIFHFWFNTFFVCDSAVVEGECENAKLVYTLNKCEIDDAHKDKEHKCFSEDFKVQITFNANYTKEKQVVTSHNTQWPQQNCTLIHNNSRDNDLNCMCDQKSSSSASLSSMGGGGVSDFIGIKQQSSIGGAINQTMKQQLQQQQQQQQEQQQLSTPDNSNNDMVDNSGNYCERPLLPPSANAARKNDVKYSQQHLMQTGRKSYKFPLEQRQQQQQQQQNHNQIQHHPHNPQEHQQKQQQQQLPLQPQYQQLYQTSTGVNVIDTNDEVATNNHNKYANNATVHTQNHHLQMHTTNSNTNTGASASATISTTNPNPNPTTTNCNSNINSNSNSNTNQTSISSKSSSISSHSSSATGDNDEEDWESGECPAAKPLLHNTLLYLSSLKPTLPAIHSPSTSTTSASNLSKQFNLNIQKNNSGSCSDKLYYCGDDDGGNDDNDGDDDDNDDKLQNVHPNRRLDATPLISHMAKTTTAITSFLSSSNIMANNENCYNFKNMSPSSPSYTYANNEKPVKTEIKVEAHDSPLQIESHQTGTAAVHPDLMQNFISNTHRKPALFKRKSFKPLGKSAVNQSMIVDGGVGGVGDVVVSTSQGLQSGAGLASTSKQKLKMKLKKNKLKLSRKFEWFQSYFRADPNEFCENFVQHTTTMRRNSVCSVASSTHKVSQPMTNSLRRNISRSQVSCLDKDNDQDENKKNTNEREKKENKNRNGEGEGEGEGEGNRDGDGVGVDEGKQDGDDSAFIAHMLSSSLSSVAPVSVSASTSAFASNPSLSEDFCDDYYSSICDNQLSFNNSPCKSPRSLVELGAGSYNSTTTTPLSGTTVAYHDLKVESRYRKNDCDRLNVVIVAAKPAKTHVIGFNIEEDQSLATEKGNPGESGEMGKSASDKAIKDESFINGSLEDSSDDTATTASSSIYYTPQLQLQADEDVGVESEAKAKARSGAQTQADPNSGDVNLGRSIASPFIFPEISCEIDKIPIENNKNEDIGNSIDDVVKLLIVRGSSNHDETEKS